MLRSDGSTCLNSFLIGLATSHKGHVLPELPFKLSVWIRLREHVNVQTLPAIKVKHMRLSELPPAPCDWMLSICLLYGADVPCMKWSYGACWAHGGQRSRLLLDHAIRRSSWGAQRGRADAFVEFGIWLDLMLRPTQGCVIGVCSALFRSKWLNLRRSL